MNLGSICEPTLEELIGSSKERPLSWNPTIRNTILQSRQSITEQQFALNLTKKL